MVENNIDFDDSNELEGSLNNTGTHPNRHLFTGKLGASESKRFTLKLWVDQNATSAINGKVFAGKIRVEAIQSKSGVGENNESPVPAPSKD